MSATAVSLSTAVAEIAAGAAERDRRPAPPPFPSAAVDALRAAGALAATATPGADRPPAGEELDLVRRVAGADAGIGRILDGHLNAVERIAVQAGPEVRDTELAAVRDAGRLLGVWGGQPRGEEGSPLTLDADGRLDGVLTFCSGAGGVERALVLVPGIEGPEFVLVDAVDEATVEVDDGWYRARGLAASVSHRVVFRHAPVIARIGPVVASPWLARDALRTAASWAGMADAARRATLDELRARPARSMLDELAAGEVLTEAATIDAWVRRAATAMDAGAPELDQLAVYGRAAIAAAARRLLDVAARATGSHPFATGGALDRARRDLELFLLQHRLEPLLARSGARALADGNP